MKYEIFNTKFRYCFDISIFFMSLPHYGKLRLSLRSQRCSSSFGRLINNKKGADRNRMTEWFKPEEAPKNELVICYNKNENWPKIGNTTLQSGACPGYSIDFGWRKEVTAWTYIPTYHEDKKKHYCKCKYHPISCFTNDSGGLNLMCKTDKVSYVTEVIACPFCGEKADE